MGVVKISVVIPVKNGAATLQECLSSISNQTIAEDIEIVVLDSMSTDTTRDIALGFGAKIIDIPEGSFNHGLTRNLGALQASGSLLYFTVQDAWVAQPDMMERMAEHFTDSTVQAVVGHQAIPWGHADKNPVLWFKRSSEPVVETRCYPGTSFEKLTPEKQLALSNWDDVNAMYRKEALIQIPFRDTNFSEDCLWANDALQKGMKLLRDPSLVVYHYHHMRFKYMFQATFIVNYHFLVFFNRIPIIPLSPENALKAVYTLIKRKEVAIIKKPYWMLHNLLLNFSRFLSVLVFKASLSFGGRKLLRRTYGIICNQVPQGEVKKTTN